MKRCRHRFPSAFCRGLVAAVLVMAMFPAYCAGPESRPQIGRLFFRPAERQSLDERRNKHPRGDGGQREDQPAGQRITFDGFLRREGTPAVVWLNGVAQPERRSRTELPRLQGVPDAENRLVITSHGGAMARLKPGQIWDPARGTLRDCTQCSRAVIAVPDAGARPAMVAEHGETP